SPAAPSPTPRAFPLRGEGTTSDRAAGEAPDAPPLAGELSAWSGPSCHRLHSPSAAWAELPVGVVIALAMVKVTPQIDRPALHTLRPPGTEVMILRSLLSPRGFAFAAALAFASLLAGSPAFAKVLATIDGVDITDDDLQIALEDIGPSLPQ